MGIEEKLDYIVAYLLHESGHVDTPNAASLNEKWQIFRSLVNMREPKPLSKDFLTAQDEVLQYFLSEKRITHIDDLQPMKDNIFLWRGDITTLKVDAIVNAANGAMLGCFAPCHGCIDNAIHTHAGVQLRLECAKLMERQGYNEPTGSAKITSAYNLPSKYVLHTVGPIITGQVSNDDRRLLANCYSSCLALAKRHGLLSIAFCCISTGEFHFPNELAADIAIAAVADYQKSCDYKKKVVFNVFTERDERIYRERLG